MNSHGWIHMIIHMYIKIPHVLCQCVLRSTIVIGRRTAMLLSAPSIAVRPSVTNGI